MNENQEPEKKLMSRKEIDALPENPFIIRKDDYIDPNDPDLSIAEKRRLRINWNRRKNYKKKKQEKKLEENKEAIVDTLICSYNKDVEARAKVLAEAKAKRLFEQHIKQFEKQAIKKKDEFYQY